MVLSRKVTPTAPSAPVTSVSALRTAIPAVAGMRLPSRSTCTAPFAFLICPTSCAYAANPKATAATASIQRIGASLGPVTGPVTADSIMGVNTQACTMPALSRTAMFLARLDRLRALREFLESFCGEAALDHDQCLRLNLVLEE